MNTSTLRACHHEPPRQWAADVFDRVTAALVATYRRAATEPAPDIMTTTQQETATR